MLRGSSGLIRRTGLPCFSSASFRALAMLRACPCPGLSTYVTGAHVADRLEHRLDFRDLLRGAVHHQGIVSGWASTNESTGLALAEDPLDGVHHLGGVQDSQLNPLGLPTTDPGLTDQPGDVELVAGTGPRP